MGTTKTMSVKERLRLKKDFLCIPMGKAQKDFVLMHIKDGYSPREIADRYTAPLTLILKIMES